MDGGARGRSRPPRPPRPCAPPASGESAGTRITFAWAPVGRVRSITSSFPTARTSRTRSRRDFDRIVAEAKFALPRAASSRPAGRSLARPRQRRPGRLGVLEQGLDLQGRRPGHPDRGRRSSTASCARPRTPPGTSPRVRVYGSDEKGFSISDEPYGVLGFKEPVPANSWPRRRSPKLAVGGRRVLPRGRRRRRRPVESPTRRPSPRRGSRHPHESPDVRPRRPGSPRATYGGHRALDRRPAGPRRQQPSRSAVSGTSRRPSTRSRKARPG